MLRLTEVKLGLNHREDELKAEILRTLGIPEPELLGYRMHRRGYDARQSGEVLFVYTLDIAGHRDSHRGLVIGDGSIVAIRCRFHARPPHRGAVGKLLRFCDTGSI